MSGNFTSVVGISGRGECLAREDNYCELDPSVVDEYGIPVLRFNYTWSDHERLQSKHMHNTFEEIWCDGRKNPGENQELKRIMDCWRPGESSMKWVPPHGNES
jgi:hypothetical protein